MNIWTDFLHLLAPNSMSSVFHFNIFTQTSKATLMSPEYVLKGIIFKRQNDVRKSKNVSLKISILNLEPRFSFIRNVADFS